MDIEKNSEVFIDICMFNNVKLSCDLYLLGDQRDGSYAGVSSPYTIIQMRGLVHETMNWW